MATEEPQLGSIQDRIAALKQAQQAHPAPGPGAPIFRPATTERSRSANNPPAYNVAGSVLDQPSVGNQPAAAQAPWPLLPPPSITRSANSPTPDLKPKKPPPPLPTRKSGTEPPPAPARPSSRPALPVRRPTDQHRRPSFESITSDTSLSTVSTVGRGASTTSVNSTAGGSRVKAPAWGESALPPLPPKREKTQDNNGFIMPPPAKPKSKSSLSSLSSSLSSKLSLPSSKQAEARESSPARPRLPSRPSQDPPQSEEAPAPRLPPRPSPAGEMQRANGGTDDARPSLPARRLPPPSQASIKDIRQSGFNNPRPPPRPNSTPSNGAPPPIPHSTRPDLSKIQGTKPRSHGSIPSSTASPPVAAASSETECLLCRDFTGPDEHAAQYPRQSLPTQDLAWLANELTAPFPSLTDKARAIFTWLHHNIAYDVDSFFNNCVKRQTPAETLAKGLAVCEGYAGLFATLATNAGLEAIVVSGHGKGFGHTALAPGSSLPPFEGNHAWNAVKIDGGKWKLLDSCWGAGAISGKGKPFTKRFEPAMFYITNDEFGQRHFPSNKDHFFRDDGRPSISWEEYITSNHENPDGVEPLLIYSTAAKETIGRRTFRPAGRQISISNTQSPIRFQFGLLCPHWTLAHHTRLIPNLYMLMIHGVDGRKDESLPFTHVPGSGPAGGGEYWYVDVPDARMLGAPGQKLQLAFLTKLGNNDNARGVSAEEYLSSVGRTSMGWSFIAEWDLVR
ncbi:hypothetical protein N7510_007900 [Penicillium lagena]|uniref:uncharacterized protein n=1 Tax=Penicillium lagena TaxID=94218 RepID=UPI00253F88FF|nr:uncharacterized protein N7510_007900 [Penicillium lagena]KAJ5611181.1 hypothetical protein N7510_007900 [Penicillium lagena]